MQRTDWERVRRLPHWAGDGVRWWLDCDAGTKNTGRSELPGFQALLAGAGRVRESPNWTRGPSAASVNEVSLPLTFRGSALTICPWGT